MSTVSTAFSAITTASCAETVIDITETALSTANLGRPKGFLDALTSEANRGSFSLTLDPNKDRPTSSSHRKVYTSDTISVCNQDTTAQGACFTPSFSADDVASKFKTVEHRIDLSIQRKITFDLEAFKAFCISPQEYLTKRLLAMRVGVQQEINTKLIAKGIAYQGAYNNGVDSIANPINLTWLKANSAGGYLFDPVGYARIKDEYAKLGHPYSNIFTVGGSHVGTIQSLASFMQGANVNGVSNTAIPNLYLDYGVDAFHNDTDNHLLTWAAGALQVVGYNDVSDDMIRVSTSFQNEKMRVPDPFGTGIEGEWDFYFTKDATGCLYEMRWERWLALISPVPYDGTCGKKPILGFTVDCAGNSCPDSSSGHN